MIASILQAVFEVVLLATLELVCHFIAWLVVPVGTLGRVQPESLAAATARRKLSWHGLYHRHRGRLWLNSDSTTLVGFLILAGAGATILRSALHKD